MNKVMFGHFSRDSLFTMFAIALVVIAAFALKPAPAYAADADTIILYKNGTAVVQSGGAPQTKAYGEVDKIIGLDSWDSIDKNHIVKLIFEDDVLPVGKSRFFEHLDALELIEGMEHFKTSQITDMAGMFSGCKSLRSLDLSSWDTRNVKGTDRMFQYCLSLEALNLKGFDTSQVTDMDFMFSDCSSLRSIDLASFDTTNVTTMWGMFLDCASLEALDLGYFNTSNVEEMSAIFSGCASLKSLDLSTLSTSNVQQMMWAFQGCQSLTHLDLSDLDTSSLHNMKMMFAECTSLRSIDLSGIDTSRVHGMSGLFFNCKSLKSIDLSGFNTQCVSHLNSMFRNCISLQDCDLSSFRTPTLESTYGMFDGCVSLEEIDLSHFDMSNVNTTKVATNGLEWPLYEIDSWETVTESAKKNMFKDCRSLRKISLPAEDFRGLLPTPSPQYIKRATGMWQNSKGQLFTSTTLPTSRADTYTAQLAIKSEGPGGGAAPSTKPPTTPPAVTMPASLSKASVIVKNRSYTGRKLKPSSVTVKLGGKTLRKNVDYTVSCKGGKKVGSYKVTIKGKGAYRGSKSATFKIVPKGTSLSKLKKARKGFTVIWKKQARETNGYQIRYSTSKSMKGAKTKTAEGRAKSSLKIAKLKGGKKYYVQVRTYKKAGGKTYYSSWSKAKTVRTAK